MLAPSAPARDGPSCVVVQEQEPVYGKTLTPAPVFTRNRVPDRVSEVGQPAEGVYPSAAA